MQSENENKLQFVEKVKSIVEYWAKQDVSDYEKCDGVAYTVLSALDGLIMGLPGYEVRPLDEEGNIVGDDIAGFLHTAYSRIGSDNDD